uniref:hypothetical protein n=1 Tax=Nocardia cyriacigeorgica TaxID=135487 RepID=UPI002453EFAE
RIVEDSSSGNLSYIWADAHYLLGMLLRHTGDHDTAEKVLKGLQGSGLGNALTIPGWGPARAGPPPTQMFLREPLRAAPHEPESNSAHHG